MANYITTYFVRIATRLALLLCTTILLISSCQQKIVDNGDYSDAFKVIFTNVTHLYETYKVDEGLRYLDSATAKINHPNINDRFRTYAFKYVYWKKIKLDNKKGLVYADSMMQMARLSVNQKQYVSNYSEASFAKGDAYFDMEQYNDAYLSYFQGYQTGKDNLNNVAISDYSYRMGMIMYKQGHYKLAVRYFKDSYEKNAPTTNTFADFYRKQELLDNIALGYKHAGDIDSAIIYFDKTVNYINEQAPRFQNRAKMLDMAKGVVYGNKAEVVILKGDKQEAIRLLQKSAAINLEKGNDNEDAELTEIKLGQLYYDMNQQDNLADLLKNIRIQLDSIKNMDAEIGWNRLMGKYFEHRNDPAKAIVYFEHYNTLKDSAVTKSQALKESDVNQQVANFEKQYQITGLRSNNKLQRVYIYIGSVGVLTLIFVIFVIVRYWKRSRRDVKTFRYLNNQINRQKGHLEEALTELSNNSQEKDRILRTVTHDLRNPIGGIASLTSVMVAEDGYSQEQKELLKLIKETSYDTIELINEILEATSKSEAEIIKQPVEINSLLNNTVELMRFKAAEKNQQITVDFLEDAEELVINREKIRRVISNLISNAIKFSPAGSTISIELSDKRNSVEISVSDQGIGIPADLKDKVFNMFTEAKRPGTLGEKSFGLGLSICRQIIEKQHNGKIWFDSDGEHGTTFYVSLQKSAIKEEVPVPEMVS